MAKYEIEVNRIAGYQAKPIGKMAQQGTLNGCRKKAKEFLESKTFDDGYILVIKRDGKRVGYVTLDAVPTDPIVTVGRRYPKKQYVPMYSPSGQVYRHYIVTSSGGISKRVFWTPEWMPPHKPAVKKSPAKRTSKKR